MNKLISSILFQLILVLYSNIAFTQNDSIITVLEWDIPTSNLTYVFDADTLENVAYNMGSGLSQVNSYGTWKNVKGGFIYESNYVEIKFSPKSGSNPMYIELTGLDFTATTDVNPDNFGLYTTNDFQLAYSKNSDFSDSTIIIGYPDGDLSSGLFVNNNDFEIPIQLNSNEDIYFRWYPFNATYNFDLAIFTLGTQKVIFNGIVRDSSTVESISDLSFTRGCASEASLSWSNPSGFNSATDTIIIFAKKTDLIDQGVPSFDPNVDYLSPLTTLDSLDGSIRDSLQYENDSDAMLVYRGVGTSIDLTNFEDGVDYHFMAFVVEGGGAQTYSNGALINGSSPNEVADVIDVNIIASPNTGVVSWDISGSCVDSVMVVCNDATITYEPNNNLIAAYNANTDYTATDSYFNTSTSTDGRVVYKDISTSSNSVIINELTNGTSYNIEIWRQKNGVWSTGVSYNLYPNDYELIITQTRSEGNDFVEFITLTQVDFGTTQYNVANYSACENNKLATYNGAALPTGTLDALGVVPAGTYVRVYTSETEDVNNTDGIVTLSSSNWALKSVGGDQVMIFTTAELLNPTSYDCSTGGGTTGNFLAGFNFGNAGWLEPGSNDAIDANTSYAPPSVSNLEMPATSTPNYSLKDQNSISGNIGAVHNSISDVNSNWSTGTGGSPSILLKDIFFDQSNFDNGDISLSESGGDLVIDYSSLVFDNNADIRYLVVVNEGGVSDAPVDRYTCYSPSIDYTLADSVVTNVSSQYANQDPCGIPTKGNGKVVYIGTSTDPLTITNTPCGGHLYVTVCAIKGNGYTANIGTEANKNFVMSDNPQDYYSTGTGSVGGAFWATTSGGTGTVIDITTCASLIIENGDAITFDEEVRIGDLEIQPGGSAVMVNDIDLIITKNLQADADFIVTTNSRVKFEGFLQSDTIFGDGTIEFFEMEVNNSFTTTGLNKVLVDTNISVVEGIFITAGNLEVALNDTLTLVSRAANKAAFLGEIPGGSNVSGTFNVERYLPALSTGSPVGSGSGWRFTTSPVSGSTFSDYDDDLFTTGITGGDRPEFPYDINTSYYYFPSLQKYDETVAGLQSFGFDGDHDTIAGAPNIRVTRLMTEGIGAGEGIFSYVWSTPLTLDYAGTPNQGDIQVDLTYSGVTPLLAEDGWNLIANPYPCPVSFANMSILGGQVNTYIQLYDSESGSFVPKDRYSPATVVAAGQAFWAKAASGAPNFNFTESDKVENSEITFYKSGEELANTLIVDMVMDTNTVFNDRTVICFDSTATAGFEGTHDAYKKYAIRPEVSGLSTVIADFDSDVSINAIPELTSDVEIPIKVNIRTVGDYTFNFSQTGNYILGSCLTLHDLVLDSVMSIDMNSTYSFYSELRSESAPARFLLTMSPPISVETTDAMCFDGIDGSAIALGVGDGPFTYTWLDANNEELMTETLIGASVMSDLGFGFYSVVIDGNNTECGTSSLGFNISQPAAYENEWSKIDPSCTINDGSITLLLDLASSWDISWINSSTGQNGQILNKSEAYIISALSVGEWEVTTTNDCGSVSYSVVLDDLNPVVADFEISSDTVYLTDGEVLVDFTNTSENANEYSWFYGDDQVEEDNSFNGMYTYTSGGVYGVSLYSLNIDGCSDEITYELVVLDPSAIEDVSSEIIRSYVSYNNGNAQYVIELKEAKNVQVQMLNSMGQIINTQNVNVDGKTFVDLPTYDLSSGIYIIITLDDGTRIDSKKLFVRK